MSRRLPGWTLAMALLVPGVALLAACGRDAAEEGHAQAAQVDPVFLAGLEAWRLQRVVDLLRPDGWASLVGLHWLQLKAHYVGSGERIGNGVRFAFGPEKMGMVSRDEAGRYAFTPESGLELTANGEPLKGRVALRSDHDEVPTVIGFDAGKGQMSLIQRGDRHALRIRHADAPTRLQYAGLQYWPADPSWRIEARFVPSPVGTTLAVGDIIGTESLSPSPGAVEFERDGQTWRLQALGEPGRDLFLVFADGTSGHGSYPAGRFLDAAWPDEEGRVVLDFNRAYNPPCVFTLFATCPLPPAENRINLPIAAGEKNYVAKVH